MKLSTFGLLLALASAPSVFAADFTPIQSALVTCEAASSNDADKAICVSSSLKGVLDSKTHAAIEGCAEFSTATKAASATESYQCIKDGLSYFMAYSVPSSEAVAQLDAYRIGMFLKACGAIKAHESRFACYRHFTGENAPILSFNKRPPAGLSDLGVSAETTQSVQDLEGRCTSEHRFEIFMYGNIAKCVETGLISLVKIKGAAYVDNHESGDKVPLSGSRDKKILSLPAPDQHAPPANPKSDAQIGK